VEKIENVPEEKNKNWKKGCGEKKKEGAN